MTQVMTQLRGLVAPAAPVSAATQSMIQLTRPARLDNKARLSPGATVFLLEATDNKNLRVFSYDSTYLNHTPLKNRVPQLELRSFLQIDRGTLVRARAIGTE